VGIDLAAKHRDLAVQDILQGGQRGMEKKDMERCPEKENDIIA